MRWLIHVSDKVNFHLLGCQRYRLALPDLDQFAHKGLYVVGIGFVGRAAGAAQMASAEAMVRPAGIGLMREIANKWQLQCLER